MSVLKENEFLMGISSNKLWAWAGVGEQRE